MDAQAQPGREVELCFKIGYMTVWGQHLAVSGPSAALGEDQLARALPLSCSFEGEELVWQGSISLPAGTTEVLPGSMQAHAHCLVTAPARRVAWQACSPF